LIAESSGHFDAAEYEKQVKGRTLIVRHFGKLIIGGDEVVAPNPATAVTRADRAYMFGDEFRRCIETDPMKREPHPDAKPMGAFSIGQRTE